MENIYLLCIFVDNTKRSAGDIKLVSSSFPGAKSSFPHTAAEMKEVSDVKGTLNNRNLYIVVSMSDAHAWCACRTCMFRVHLAMLSHDWLIAESMFQIRQTRSFSVHFLTYS